MLSSLSIRNFRSILDMTVNFSFAEKKAPAGFRDSDIVFFAEPKKHVRLVPALALYGSNASGKSNVLMALGTFRDCAVSGVQGKFHPDKLHPEWRTTAFEATIVRDGKRFVYAIEYDRDEFRKESLAVDGTVLFSIDGDRRSFGSLATPSYPAARLEEIFRVECSTPLKKQTSSFLSVIGKRYPGLCPRVTAVYDFFNDGIVVLSENSIHLSRGVDMLAAVLEKADDPDPVRHAFERITDLLENLDIHINRMELSRRRIRLDRDARERNYLDVDPEFLTRLTSFQKEGDDIVLNTDRIRSFHQDADGREVEFDFMTEESSGTQIVAGLLGVFLAVLESGGVVAVDELDRSLHPLLLIELVRLFKDRRYNPRGAQLVFTVHNTDILDAALLRVSEVGIITKTLQDGSTLARISDFAGVGNIASFRKQYLTGCFSGIPFPYI
ncbi:ATP-binding protein [Oxalobacter aliiformigenes]|uniref:ATP-binding protein n=1 Tax=Oxalobacter aliiformigenes TaxID=2946593 RepID=A0ABY7JJX0_9BURK|nr:ATP-binding protein [Oxalobacter aliiformigenes]WAV90106.1 ATP-binding protein [Oxalobacter aliiformigenes]WAV92302.1 ATP-binding protein [Oxalobacter aliiformigenes]WAV94289.1 ATP-binding protein [Oxalobacter aliiformigenes]WAV97898.1 ATP-binding protein [Oxalobacter aliiformigenes]